MIKYIQGVGDDELKLKINDITMSDWYAEAAFAVHANMKNHMGGVLTMVKAEMQTISMNKKINTKISTEAELIAANYV